MRQLTAPTVFDPRGHPRSLKKLFFRPRQIEALLSLLDYNGGVITGVQWSIPASPFDHFQQSEKLRHNREAHCKSDPEPYQWCETPKRGPTTQPRVIGAKPGWVT